MGKSTVVMLQMMASLETKKKIVDDAIKSLQEYKDSEYEGQQPFAQLMLCVIKFEQGDNADPLEVVERAMKDESIVDRAVKIHNEENPDDRIDDETRDNNVEEEREQFPLTKIPLGEHGDA